MTGKIIITMNSESAEMFKEFASEYPNEFFLLTKHNFSFQDMTEIIVTITPSLLSALTAYLVARLKYSKGNEQNEIVIKSGEIEIRLKKQDINPESVVEMIEKLQASPDD